MTSAVSTFFRSAMPRRILSMRAWAEKYFVVPKGEMKGLRYRVDTQPFAIEFFRAVESGKHRRIAVTGCVQSGKTLLAFVIPVLYHLFEVGETVIVATPTADIGKDKWIEELNPAIAEYEESVNRRLMPQKGPGSQGAFASLIKFENGATLRFMSAKGGDKARSNFTSRVVVATEIDGMDEAGDVSRETDPMSQIEARTESFGDRAVVYMECTLSLPDGRTNREVAVRGTDTRLALACPHCCEYFVPERNDLVGWQTAKTYIEAREQARLQCPHCDGQMDNEQRMAAIGNLVATAKGQTVEKGMAVGDTPATDTFGLRWNAIHNAFWTMEKIAEAEWRTSQEMGRHKESEEKRLHQYYWTIPYEANERDIAGLDVHALAQRITMHERGVVPDDCLGITVGADPGGMNTGIHWVAMAWLSERRRHIIDYGRLFPRETTASAVLACLARWWADVILPGWGGRQPDCTFVDSNWLTDAVDSFVAQYAPNRARSVRGYSATDHQHKHYKQPTSKSGTVRYVGDHWHEVLLQQRKTPLVHLDADFFKRSVQDSLRLAIGDPGCLTLHQASEDYHLHGPIDPSGRRIHIGIAQQLASEREERRFNEKRGLWINAWVAAPEITKANHLLDSTAIAEAAGVYIGLDEEAQRPRRVKRATSTSGLTTPDGRAFKVSDR